MSKLSIPTIENLPGFDRVEVLGIADGRVKFRLVGSSSDFGAQAGEHFVSHAVAACLDGASGHLYRTEVTRVVGAADCYVTSDTPR